MYWSVVIPGKTTGYELAGGHGHNGSGPLRKFFHAFPITRWVGFPERECTPMQDTGERADDSFRRDRCGNELGLRGTKRSVRAMPTPLIHFVGIVVVVLIFLLVLP